MPKIKPSRALTTSNGRLSQHGVTTLLRQWTDGREGASGQLIELVYDELRRMAAQHLGKERADHTLQPTELVNEAYLRLRSQHKVDLRNRAQFFGLAGTLMRRILVDHARSRLTRKRGHGAEIIPLDGAPEPSMAADLDVETLISLDEALDKLQEQHPRQVKVVDLHFFAGRSFRETAEILGTSMTKAKGEWAAAKTWLASELSPSPVEKQT